jgi:hypothetical protein
MSVLRKLACLMAGVGALMVVSSAQAAGAGEAFSGGTFTCLQFTNGLGDNSSSKMQSNLARLWILGYLAGYYKAQGKLEMTDDAGEMRKIDELMVSRCREFPQATILGMAAQALANEPHKLPKTVMGDFSPDTYTCGQHVTARGGVAADATKADLAEMWGFAFIQGFKNVGSPNMEIRSENMPSLMGVANKACGNAKETKYLELMALVAEKVKIQ